MLRTLSFLFLLNIGLSAQTIIPNGSKVSGVWTKANSPYLISGHARVSPDSSLTIEPGVEIKFAAKQLASSNALFHPADSGYGFLMVEGVFNAIGTESEPIVFTK